LYAVGTVYTNVWDGKAWQNYPPAPARGWMSYIGYAGNRQVLPDPQFNYTGQAGGRIQVLGPGLSFKPGRYRLAILSAIASNWVAHYPSKGKIFVYFIPDK
jgi:hypothetical protein